MARNGGEWREAFGEFSQEKYREFSERIGGSRSKHTQMRPMVLVYIKPTKLGDFWGKYVGFYIPAPWFAYGIPKHIPIYSTSTERSIKSNQCGDMVGEGNQSYAFLMP